MFFIYVLWSYKLQKRYIGFCTDIQKRIKEHNSGKSKFTKGGIPWKLIHYEEYPDKTSALKRELFLKSGQGRKFLDDVCNTAVRGFSAEG